MRHWIAGRDVLMILVSLLPGLALMGCLVNGLTPITGRERDLEVALEQFHAHSANAATWEEARASILRAASEDGELVVYVLRARYQQGLEEEPGDGLDRRQHVKARAILWALGRAGHSEKLGDLLPAATEPALLYALADSRGVTLYYYFVEGGRYDGIVDADQALEIMIRSQVFQEWHDELVAWRKRRYEAKSAVEPAGR